MYIDEKLVELGINGTSLKCEYDRIDHIKNKSDNFEFDYYIEILSNINDFINSQYIKKFLNFIRISPGNIWFSKTDIISLYKEPNYNFKYIYMIYLKNLKLQYPNFNII